MTRDGGKYPLSVLKKTYELFVGTNETVLYMWVSVERDFNVLPSLSGVKIVSLTGYVLYIYSCYMKPVRDTNSEPGLPVV